MGLVALGLLMGILLFLSWVSLSQKKLVAYDANSYGPDGLKALDLILKKSGYQVTLVPKCLNRFSSRTHCHWLHGRYVSDDTKAIRNPTPYQNHKQINHLLR